MKIFGIGFSRTGTSSLTLALRELGFNIIHGPRPGDFDSILKRIKDCDGGTDFSIAYHYRNLYSVYPNAKYILTERSLKSWLLSVEYFLNNAYDSGADDFMRFLMYGDSKFDRFKYANSYIIHNKKVKEFFKNKNNLLVMDLTNGDGWEKLCGFLGINKIPNKPFPHSHMKKQILQKRRK